MLKLMHQRPTTVATVVLAVALAFTWVMTMDGGVLSWMGL